MDAVTETGSRCVTTNVASGNVSTKRGELLEVLGGLEHPARPAPQPLERLEDLAQVGIAGALVAGQVVVAPQWHRRRGLEEHRREVDGQQLDFLVGVRHGHLVHAVEVRQRGVEERESHLGAPEARVRFCGAQLLAFGQHGLEAFPVGERTQGRVGRDEVVQVGGPGTGQAADDDRGVDALVKDLGVSAYEVLDQEPVLEQPEQQGVLLQHAGAVEAALVAHGAAEHIEAFDEVRGTEVVQPGLGNRRLHQRSRSQLQLRPRLFHEVEDGPHIVAVARLGQVVDADAGRTVSGQAHTVSTGSTSTWGCPGVSAGKNQRNQMRPLWWPAVDTQLGWSGRRGETTMMKDPSLS